MLVDFVDWLVVWWIDFELGILDGLRVIYLVGLICVVFGDSWFVVVVCLFGWFWVKICVYVCLLYCWLDVVGWTFVTAGWFLCGLCVWCLCMLLFVAGYLWFVFGGGVV